MYRMYDFKKCCPNCQALSKSLTKKKCDFCKCVLIELDSVKNITQYNDFNNNFSFKIWAKKKAKTTMREVFDDKKEL